MIRQLKHIAADEGCSLNDLIEEAIGLLIEKRRKTQPVAQESER
jgi:predicted HicB family RNase H-like nuclease